MAETLISPGVLARENDSSFVSRRPVTVGAAIIGPTVKGPVEIPTIVTTYNEFVNKFGTTFVSGSVNDSDTYTFFTSIAAYNYFVNGGESLLVARVVSGSGAKPYTSATSSLIATGSGGPTTGLSPFVLSTISQGAIMNNTSTEVSGALSSGSADNVRWQIVNANSSSGTFDLLIRRGDDNTLQPVVLETWTGLNLDPNSPNYVARVIGDQTQNYNSTTNQIEITGSFSNKSNYIYISAVNYTTYNFFDNNGNFKPQYTGSIPVNGSGSFGGAVGTIKGGSKFYDQIDETTNSQGLVADNYNNMVSLLANTDDYKYNILLTPGLYDAGTFSGVISNIITNTQNRGDCIYILDSVKYGKTVPDVV
jgi:hypothetical protein